MEDVKYATFWQRFGAAGVDIVLFFIIVVIVSTPPFLSEKFRNLTMDLIVLLMILWLGYFVIFPAICGATLGKKMFKIKVINREGNKAKLLTILFRESIGKLISSILMYLGFFSMWLDDKGRSWHDKIARTEVVSGNKYSHKRNVGWFYVCLVLLLLLQSYPVYLGIKKIVNRESEEKPCGFEILSGPSKTNHFDIYVEDPKLQYRMVMEGEIFERAFDYAFWSISGVKEKVTRSVVCMYTKDDTFVSKMTFDGVSDWAAAYYDPEVNVISFGPSYWNLSRDKVFEDYGLGRYIYHEITHYVIDNYLYQNKSSIYVDVWLNEGMAEYLSGNCEGDGNKAFSNKYRMPWETMSQGYYTEGSYIVSDYYRQSCLMTKFLIEKYGADFPKEVIDDIIQNKKTTSEAVVEKSGGKSYQLLDKEWQKWLLEE